MLLPNNQKGRSKLTTEDERTVLIKDLKASGYISYSGLLYTGQIYRGYDDFKQDDPYVHISFIPGGKTIKGGSVYRGKRQNPPYKNYGYVQKERGILTVFAKDNSGIRGRRIADGWLWQVETYIKNYWSSKINGMSVDRSSFTAHREIPNFNVKRMYGMETMFDIYSDVVWTDEPVSGIKSPSGITAISIVTQPTTGTATGMFKLWVN
jgi:hypothetical protein